MWDGRATDLIVAISLREMKLRLAERDGYFGGYVSCGSAAIRDHDSMFKRITKYGLAWLLLIASIAGCSHAPEPSGEPARKPSRTAKKLPSSKSPAPGSPRTKRTGVPERSDPREDPPAIPESPGAAPADPPAEAPEQEPEPKPRRSLGDLLSRPADSAARWIPELPRMQVDDARAAAGGIRKLSGKRLTLYTDMPPAKAVDQLPEVFDRAFVQWCEYFRVDPAQHPDWSMTGFLMKEKARFQQTGLLPGDLPSFKNGYARNYTLWLYDQPSDYYRRHLMLHEGTHGFMNTILGACGPPWYMEGIAELLATHRWGDGRLRLNHFPTGREEVPYWGRIRIIKDAMAENRGKRLVGVIEYSASAHLETEPYAWCWAAAALLDGHPRYRDRFRQLAESVRQGDFTERFYRLMHDDWDQLCEEWQLLVSTLEYGHDVAATAVDFTPGEPLPPDGASVTIAAKGGWQDSRLRLEAGVEYGFTATGRYQVDDQPQIWWCEPGGVSIRYYRGRPLGILLAAIRPDQPDPSGLCGLLRPAVLGLRASLKPKQTGTLYLKINDSAAELSDNAGELKVEIKMNDE